MHAHSKEDLPGDVWHFPKERRKEREKRGCRKVRRMGRREK